MNRNISRLLGFASLVIGGAIVLGGCGPQDLNDPDYLMQLDDAGVANAEQDQDPNAANRAQNLAQNRNLVQGRQPIAGGQPGAQPVAVEGQAVVAEPVAVVEPVPVPVIPIVDLPPQFVREPDVVTPLPPTSTFSGEQVNYRQLIDHYREIWVPSENVHFHNIHNFLVTNHRYFQRVINAPTARTVVTTTADADCTEELLPTEVVTLPVVDCGVAFGGCVGVADCGGFGGGFGGPGYVGTPFYGRGAYFSGNRPWF